jgi:hypothetical protein
MQRQELPQPTTAVEMYLAAILDELRQLNLLELPAIPTEDVELREPKKTRAAKETSNGQD